MLFRTRRVELIFPSALDPRLNCPMTMYSNYKLSDPGTVIEAHLPQVKLMANRLAAKLPPWVEVNDLVGAGLLGLLEALDKYDSNKGVMLRTYAESHVRGAILKRLRDIDWAPSSSRQAKRVEKVYPKSTVDEVGGAARAFALSVSAVASGLNRIDDDWSQAE